MKLDALLGKLQLIRKVVKAIKSLSARVEYHHPLGPNFARQGIKLHRKGARICGFPAGDIFQILNTFDD